MKRTTTFVLFASIFAITATGVLGFNANSATTLMVTPTETQAMGVLGHVEYKLLDDSGMVKQYMQGDNEVVNDGEDCVTNYLFGVATCEESANNFNYIGIGNGTDTNGVGSTNATLADGNDSPIDSAAALQSDCAHVTGTGELARRLVTPSLTSAASGDTGAIIVLETTSPFTFTGANATDQTVMDSGVFNDQRTGVSATTSECTANETGGWDMFSRQRLNGATGISVSEGDSLSVKWTITVG